MRRRNELRDKFIGVMTKSRKKVFTSKDFTGVVPTGSKSVPRSRLISTQLFLLKEKKIVRRVSRGKYVPVPKTIKALKAAA